MSIGVKIGIGILGGALLLVAIVIVWKTIKLRMSMKEDRIPRDSEAAVTSPRQTHNNSDEETENDPLTYGMIIVIIMPGIERYFLSFVNFNFSNNILLV